MTNRQTYDIDDQRLNEAADWYARMGDDAASEEDWLAFTDWLEASEANQQAYDTLEMTALALEGADVPTSLRTDERTAHNSAPAEQPDNTVIDARNRFRRTAAWAAVAAAVAAVWMAFVGLGMVQSPDPTVEIFETGPTETRRVTLADGSSVHLNINTRLVVELGAEERNTRLSHGEALFDVASDKKRPFRVALGDREVTVVGTVFNIVRHQGRVTVTVQEGIVDVAPPNGTGATGPPAERLTEGLQLTHEEGTRITRVAKVDADAVTAWQEGFLEYENTPLAVIAADLKRYAPVPVQLEGDVGQRLFSGILHTQNLEGAFDLLKGALDLDIQRVEGVIIIRASAEEP